MKKIYKCIIVFVMLVAFGALILDCFSANTFNEERAVLELYIQNLRGAKMKFDDNGTLHYIGKNNCYYLGIDKNRNLYVRHGDGIAFSEYFNRRNDNNPKKMFYDGCGDLIPQPTYEECVKLSREEYDEIVLLMDQASSHYRNEPNINIINSVFDYDTFKFYKYKKNYFNIYDDYDIREKAFNSTIYDNLEKILSNHMGIEKYPE